MSVENINEYRERNSSWPPSNEKTEDGNSSVSTKMDHRPNLELMTTEELLNHYREGKTHFDAMKITNGI